jgi:large subunit ribosomal protein L1
MFLRRVSCTCARQPAPLREVLGACRQRGGALLEARSISSHAAGQRPRSLVAAAVTTTLPAAADRGFSSLTNPLVLSSVPTGSDSCVISCVPRRSYVSRAHPTVAEPIGLHTALQSVLQDAERRAVQRKKKAARNGRADAPSLDETIELAINLNLDPRKPNQALRGSIQLPSGSGKFVNCLVFTGDADVAEAIKEQVSTSSSKIEVGGEDLVDRIASGQVNLDQFQRGMGTADMQSILTKRLARVLGPRGLMPNAKTGTLLESPSMLPSALETQLAGTVIQYRTDREGIVHVRVGRASFGKQRLLDNVGAIAREVSRAKPDAYGKGKKTSKNAKYLLGAAITSTQGKGYKVDPRTLDPSSPFFLNWIEGEEEEKVQEEEAEGTENAAA